MLLQKNVETVPQKTPFPGLLRPGNKFSRASPEFKFNALFALLSSQGVITSVFHSTDFVRISCQTTGHYMKTTTRYVRFVATNENPSWYKLRRHKRRILIAFTEYFSKYWWTQSSQIVTKILTIRSHAFPWNNVTHVTRQGVTPHRSRVTHHFIHLLSPAPFSAGYVHATLETKSTVFVSQWKRSWFGGEKRNKNTPYPSLLKENMNDKTRLSRI